MKHAVTFHQPVYKNQGTLAAPTNVGLHIEVGDTLRVLVDNDTAAPTSVDLTVTGVFNDYKTIEWDGANNTSLRPDDIIRVHRRHQWFCVGPVNRQVVLTEASASSVLARVNSLVLDGAIIPINVVEEGAAANGFEATFPDRLVAALQSILGEENAYVTGAVAGSAGSQTLTLKFAGMNFVPGAWNLAGLTAGSWTTF